MCITKKTPPRLCSVQRADAIALLLGIAFPCNNHDSGIIIIRTYTGRYTRIAVQYIITLYSIIIIIVAATRSRVYRVSYSSRSRQYYVLCCGATVNCHANRRHQTTKPKTIKAHTFDRWWNLRIRVDFFNNHLYKHDFKRTVIVIPHPLNGSFVVAVWLNVLNKTCTIARWYLVQFAFYKTQRTINNNTIILLS